MRLDILEAGQPAGQPHQAEVRDQAPGGERPEPGRAACLGHSLPGERAELTELMLLRRGRRLVRRPARGPQISGLPPVLRAG